MSDNSPSDHPAPADEPPVPFPDDAAVSNAEAVSAPETRLAEGAEGGPAIRSDVGLVPGRGFSASVGWLVIFLVVNTTVAVPVAIVLSAVAGRPLPAMS